MTVRVVLDTNVIVSAALATRHHLVPAGRAFFVRRARARRTRGSHRLRGAFLRICRGPRSAHFRIPRATVRRFVAALRAHAELATPARIPSAAVHPKDANVLAAAVGGSADFLITGNVRDFPATYRTTKIVTPATFLTSLVLGQR